MSASNTGESAAVDQDAGIRDEWYCGTIGKRLALGY
jgi:hypothetical protein